MIEAYDVKAVDYDAQVQGDAWMRDVLWDRYTRLFSAGQSVLDVGCGTGIDGLFLAEHGIHVLGIDSSAAMIAEAKSKLAGTNLQDLVELRVMDVRDIDSLPRGAFNGLVSAFASLSTAVDLSGFAASAARILRPRGHVLIHLLNRTSLWEWLGLVHSRRIGAARRLGAHSVRTFTIGDRSVPHHVYRAAEAYGHFFSAHFALRRAYGIGILRPPHTVRRVPSMVVTGLDRLERPLRSVRPFRDWGRFFVLELEKR